MLVMGPRNLPAALPFHASQMYARNLVEFVGHLFGRDDGEVDYEDEIVSATVVTHEGEIKSERVKANLAGSA